MSAIMSNIKSTDAISNEYLENYPGWKFWKRRRVIVAILAFFGYFNVYSLRSNLSIAVVAMTEKKPVLLENNTVIYEPEFDWDSKTQGLVLSSFFYGYITTQIFGGWLSAKIGGKKVFGIGIAITGFLTLLTPWAATVSVYFLVGIRIVEGIFEGVTYPCMQAVWARWAPPLERTKLATIAFSGTYMGTVVAMPASAYLATDLGWPSVFYVFGVIALIWFVLWWVFVAESPEQDSRISPNELEFIRRSLKNIDSKNIIPIKHPWKKMLTSVPVWAVVVAHFADTWGITILLTQLPTFMDNRFNYGLGTTGFLSGLPYLAMCVLLQFSGQLADWIRKKGFLTTTQVRKTFSCCAFTVHAIFMIAAAYTPTVVGTVICLVLAAGLGVFTWSGWGVNYLDIAPQHASVLVGISNTVGCLAAITAPLLTGYIVTIGSNEEWQIVFIIAGAILMVGSVVYGFCASGELQEWAVQVSTKEEIKSEIKSCEGA